MNDAHEDFSMMCHAELDEENEWGNPKTCDTIIEYPDDYVTIRKTRSRGKHGDRLVFRCPDCDAVREVCPLCYGDGSFIGESTGERLMCHNCRPNEAARQMRGC